MSDTRVLVVTRNPSLVVGMTFLGAGWDVTSDDAIPDEVAADVLVVDLGSTAAAIDGLRAAEAIAVPVVVIGDEERGELRIPVVLRPFTLDVLADAVQAALADQAATGASTPWVAHEAAPGAPAPASPSAPAAPSAPEAATLTEAGSPTRVSDGEIHGSDHAEEGLISYLAVTGHAEVDADPDAAGTPADASDAEVGRVADPSEPPETAPTPRTPRRAVQRRVRRFVRRSRSSSSRSTATPPVAPTVAPVSPPTPPAGEAPIDPEPTPSAVEADGGVLFVAHTPPPADVPSAPEPPVDEPAPQPNEPAAEAPDEAVYLDDVRTPREEAPATSKDADAVPNEVESPVLDLTALEPPRTPVVDVPLGADGDAPTTRRSRRLTRPAARVAEDDRDLRRRLGRLLVAGSELERLVEEVPLLRSLPALGAAIVRDVRASLGADTVVYWTREDDGWHVLAGLGLTPTEARLVVPTDQPLLVEVDATGGGLLLDPVDAVHAAVTGIGGAHTDSFMAASIAAGPVRYGILAVGRHRPLSSRDLDQLCALATEAAPGVAVAEQLARFAALVEVEEPALQPAG